MTHPMNIKGPDNPNAAYSHEDIARIKQLLLDGKSARQISDEMNRSRSAIIGIVQRNEVLRTVGFARSNGKSDKSKAKAPKRQRVKRSARLDSVFSPPVSVIKPPRYIPPSLPALRSLEVPLVDLEPGQCKFATNNAKPGEMHLFCGHPTKEGSSYCPAHDVVCCNSRAMLEDVAA